MEKRIFVSAAGAVMTILLVTACSESNGAKTQVKTGGDRDAHGCIASAGYRWCAKTEKCERPWELAQKEHFEKSAEAFDRFCNNPTQNKEKE